MEIDPELIVLKLAYKRELIDADDLSEFHIRFRREQPDDGYLAAALDWEILTQAQIDELLAPATIADALQRQQIDGRNAAALERLID